MIETTPTTFGTVRRNAHETEVSGTQAEFSGWATQPGSAWPGSTLRTLDALTATFDARGDLVDLIGDDSADLSADELNAWTSECLIRAGYPNHPAIR